MDAEYLIRGANVVNEGEIFVGDVLVRGGIIAKVQRGGGQLGDGMQSEGARIIDATGKYLIPGIIDEHVHFREPGLTLKADIASESRAAVAGGVTSFMDMPNTSPATTTRELLQQKFALAAEKSLANYSFYIGATNDNLDEVLKTDFSGVCGVKLFMGSSTGNMLVDKDKAIEELFRGAPCLIAAHCEDEGIVRSQTALYREMAARGEIAPDATIHPRIRTAEACLRSSERAVSLAEKTGAHLHVLHVSTAAELDLFRSDIPLAQKKITAETCPHYLCLTDSDYEKMSFAIKCNPAIKSVADRDALRKALRSGLVDTIGTDHAPHLWEEKFTGDYFTSKSGFPSIQHSLQLMAELCRDGILTLPEMVRLMCHNPATLYRIDRRGFIREGWHADLALIDLDSPHAITSEGELSKCGWTPYEGRAASAKVTHTFVGGHLVYENGRFDESFRGERLQFNN